VNPCLDSYLEEVTGRVPLMVRYVKDATMPQPAYSTWATYSVLDSDDEEMILKKAIYAVESEMTPQFINKTKWIYN